MDELEEMQGLKGMLTDRLNLLVKGETIPIGNFEKILPLVFKAIAEVN